MFMTDFYVEKVANLTLFTYVTKITLSPTSLFCQHSLSSIIVSPKFWVHIYIITLLNPLSKNDLDLNMDVISMRFCYYVMAYKYYVPTSAKMI